MNAITFQNRRYLCLQAPELRDVDHAVIISNLVSAGFNGVVVLASTRTNCFYDSKLFPQSSARINGEHLFPHFIKLAHAVGLHVFSWFIVGDWERWSYSSFPMTPEWNLRNDLDIQADYDWLNMTRPDVREAVVDVVREALNVLNPDGVLLDYIRFESKHSALHEHVTRTVETVRGLMTARFPGKELLATCFRAEGGWSGLPRYENYAQHWRNWLANDLLDHVFVTMYRGPDTLYAGLEGLPSDERISIKLTPGGEGKVLDPFTEDELGEMFLIVRDARLFLPVLWHYDLMTPMVWRLYNEFVEEYT